MSIPVNEQETVIQISRDSNEANIWTSDTTMMTKLDSFCSESDSWRLTSTGRINGEIVNKEYVSDKALISFRKNRNKTTPLTEEQKAQRRAFLEKAKRMKHEIH